MILRTIEILRNIRYVLDRYRGEESKIGMKRKGTQLSYLLVKKIQRV